MNLEYITEGVNNKNKRKITKKVGKNEKKYEHKIRYLRRFL